jgi:hypothetical protein
MFEQTKLKKSKEKRIQMEEICKLNKNLQNLYYLKN